MPILARAILFCAAFFCAVTAEARSDWPFLSARPAAASRQLLPPGISRVSDTAFIYRPAAVSGPAPLLLLLHGAGGDARAFLERFVPVADKLGFMILAPQSAGDTWDFAQRRHFGPDVGRIDAALRQTFASAPVARGHVAVAGFSDGASYALALGLANPQLFDGIVAWSPGFLTQPGPYAGARIFLVHGRRDTVLPFSFAQDLARKFEEGGAQVRLKPFKGGHEIDWASLEEALRFSLRLR